MPVTLTRNTRISSEALNALRAAAWADPQQCRAWEPVFARSFGWVCAHDGQRLIGFVNIVWDGGAHTFLLDTTVHRGYQRRGIGTALVREALALARSSGAEWLHVDYDADLAPFYRGCGFRPTSAGLLYLVGDSLKAGSAQELEGL